MENGVGLFVGININETHSMVSFLDVTAKEPQNILFSDKKTTQDNPIPLSSWGQISKSGDVAQTETIVNFVATLIEYAKRLTKATKINKVCIAVEDFRIDTLDAIAAIMMRLQYSREQWCVISHEESFAYYAYNQKRELYASGVMLLDYKADGIYAYLMSNGKYGDTELIMENRYNISGDNFKSVYEKNAGLETVMDDIMNWLSIPLQEHIISSIYLTGEGFNVESFPEKLTRFFCNRRKVFAGQNLFVKGGGFGAYEESVIGTKENVILSCSNRVTTGIEVDICERGVAKRLRVIKPGTNWYTARRRLDFILEDVNVIRVILRPCNSNKESYEEIDISSIPYRKGKMTRIELDIKFNSDSRCTITVKDKGFGDFVKSSGKIVSKDIEL
ncbi:MAG: hypothetical protein IJB96_09480 [Lachnospira sp.]|nr:hypothetical protein [Lachnospira sp.]